MLYPSQHDHHSKLFNSAQLGARWHPKKGKCLARYKCCFHQYGLSCAILWLYITRSSLSTLYIAYARHDRDVDIRLEHDTLAARRSAVDSGSMFYSRLTDCTNWLKCDQQLKPAGYFVLSYLLSIVTPIFFVAWSLHCFIFGQSFIYSKLSRTFLMHSPSDVDSRLFLPERDLPRIHCALACHVRPQYWDDTDAFYVEVFDNPRSR
jgi:hypothetical protein